jgi:cytochrome c oxidase assembly factor CtaG
MSPRPDAPRRSAGRVLLALGLALAVAVASVAAVEAARLGPFTWHMAQAAGLGLLWAPLAAWFVGRSWGDRSLPRWAAVLVSPWVAGLLFAANFVAWHLRALHEQVFAHDCMPAVAAVSFALTGFLAWWPVCAPGPAAGRLRDPAGMLYLFLLGVPLQVLGGILTHAPAAFYPAVAARAGLTAAGALADQRTGGLLLWVPGGLVIWLAISLLWLRWSRRVARDAAGGDGPPLTLPGSGSG